jgi:hypothetical protein
MVCFDVNATRQPNTIDSFLKILKLKNCSNFLLGHQCRVFIMKIGQKIFIRANVSCIYMTLDSC